MIRRSMSFVTCSCGEGSCGEALRTSAWEAYYIWLTGRPVNLPYVSTRAFLYHSIEIKEVGNLRRRRIDHCIPRDTIHPTKSFPKFLRIEWSIFFLVCVGRVSCTGRHTGLREQGLKNKTSCFLSLYFSETPEFSVKFHNKQQSISFIFVLVFQQSCWMESVQLWYCFSFVITLINQMHKRRESTPWRINSQRFPRWSYSAQESG